MALTLSEIRAAVGAQLRANLSDEINVDIDGAGLVAPVIRLELYETPQYWASFGPRRIQSVRFVLRIDPANADHGSVIRMDRLLDSGTSNGSSIVDALDADPTFGGVADMFEIEPGLMDETNRTAEMFLIVHVRGD